MSMSKKDFIALADRIKWCNETTGIQFTEHHIQILANFCMRYPAFKAQRWLDYIAGKCGPNGGRVKA